MHFLQTPGGTALLSLAVAAISSGLVYGVLKLGPDRRRLEAGSVLDRANAANVITDSALALVESAQSDARQARKERARAWRRVAVLETMMRAAGLPIPPDEPDDQEHRHDDAQPHP